jgi:hypothetical protein
MDQALREKKAIAELAKKFPTFHGTLAQQSHFRFRIRDQFRDYFLQIKIQSQDNEY